MKKAFWRRPSVKKNKPKTVQKQTPAKPKPWTPPYPPKPKTPAESTPAPQIIPPATEDMKVKPVTHMIPPATEDMKTKPVLYTTPPATENPETSPVPVTPTLENQKSPPRAPSARKDFLKTFHSLARRWNAWEIWPDFITMAACTISNAVDKSHYDEREKTYLRIINKYNKQEQALFPELFACTVLALEENPEQDFLGDVYMELGLNDKGKRQFFTPYSVTRVMAEVAYGDLDKLIDNRGFATIHDCCCGAGATLIAAANTAREKLGKAGLNFQNHILITGQDIDPTAVMMCYIQLSLLGMAGYFKVGDSLTEPMTDGDSLENYWFTPMYFFPVWQYRRMQKGMDHFMGGHNEDRV